MAVVVALQCYFNYNVNTPTFNNYNIFTGVYKHIIVQKNLYLEYPGEYFDANHYGPFFSLIIAPFALLPDGLGLVLWNLFNTLLLTYALVKLPLAKKTKVIIAWIVAHELLTAQSSLQFNVGLLGLMLLGFSYTLRRNYWKNAIVIMIGFLVKLYGIIGLTFLLFTKNKIKFSYTVIIVLVLGFLTTAVLTPFDFVLQSYQDWTHSLVGKSNYNAYESPMANISIIGFFQKVFGVDIPVLYAVLFGGGTLLLTLLLNRHNFNQLRFQFFVLAYLLFCIVLFNTNVESPTFIIGFFAVAIWFVHVEKNYWTIGLFVFAMILTSLSPSDLFPRFIRDQYVIPYKLKVLPCILIWLDMTYRMFTERNTLSSQNQSLYSNE